MKETYNQLRERHYDEFNAFPLRAAFGPNQFRDMVVAFNLNPDSKEDLHQIVHIGYGCYILRKDIPAFNELNDRLDNEKKEFLKDDECLRDAIVSELWNYEAIYGMNDFPKVIYDAIGLPEERRNDSHVAEIYDAAWKQYYKAAIECC